MSKTILGIEIGSETIKVAQLAITGGQFKVLQHQIVTLSEKSRDHDDHLNVVEVKSTLEQIIHKMNAKKTPVCLAINSTKKIIRTRELPMASLSELEGIVKFEAEQFLPYDIAHFYVDFRVVGKVEGSGGPQAGVKAVDGNAPAQTDMLKVMIAALPKDIVDSYRDLMKECGLVVKGITLQADALYQYAKHHILKVGQGIILCDIGQKSVNTVLFEGLEFFADLSTDSGIDAMAEVFAENYGSNLEESVNCLFDRPNIALHKKDNGTDQLYKRIERLNLYFDEKHEEAPSEPAKAVVEKYVIDENVLEGSDSEDRLLEDSVPEDDYHDVDHSEEVFVEPEPVLVGNEINVYTAVHDIRREVYSIVYKEINRMMEFYRTRKFGAAIHEIYLCGGGAFMVGLVDYIQEATGLDDVKIVTLQPATHPDMPKDFALLIGAVGSAIGR